MGVSITLITADAAYIFCCSFKIIYGNLLSLLHFPVTHSQYSMSVQPVLSER